MVVAKKLVSAAFGAAVIVGGLTAGPAHAASVWSANIHYPGSNNCMEVYHSSTSNYGKVDSWNCNGTSTQRWEFIPEGTTSDGTQLYEVTNENSYLCLDVYHGSPSVGAYVDQYSCNRTAAQLWYFKNYGDVGTPSGYEPAAELVNLGSGLAAASTSGGGVQVTQQPLSAAVAYLNYWYHNS